MLRHVIGKTRVYDDVLSHFTQNNMKAGSKFATGRPATGRTYAISVRISHEAAEILSTKKNKSQYIDGLIRKDKSQS